jgi:hypothetical protein
VVVGVVAVGVAAVELLLVNLRVFDTTVVRFIKAGEE